MDRYLLQFGDVSEVDGFSEKPEDISATRATERSVLVIGRAVVPGPETFGLWRWFETWRRVDVAEGHDIGGNS